MIVALVIVLAFWTAYIMFSLWFKWFVNTDMYKGHDFDQYLEGYRDDINDRNK